MLLTILMSVFYIKKDHFNFIGQKIPILYDCPYNKNIKIEFSSFYQEMVVKRNPKVIKIESLQNKAWNDFFIAHRKLNYYLERSINYKTKMLFHGSTLWTSRNQIIWI